MHAYILTGAGDRLKKYNSKEVKRAKKLLVKVFKEHFGIDPTKKAGQRELLNRVKQFKFEQ